MTTPAQIFDYDMEARTRLLRKTQEVPSGHNAADYVTRRLDAPAADGETVPIRCSTGRAPRSTAPRRCFSTATALMASPSPPFSTSRLSLVDRGFVFAVAHIRGGKDKGYRWYTDGKHTKKVNTFTDFIAAGEFLAAAGLYPARPHHRQRRLRRRHADGRHRQHGARSLPRHHRRRPLRRCAQHHARRDPAANAAGVARMGQPDRVQGGFRHHPRLFALRQRGRQALPAYLRLCGPDGSARHLLGARQMDRAAARANTSDNPILLKTNMEAGHGGASGRFEALKELAVDYAFALKITGNADA